MKNFNLIFRLFAVSLVLFMVSCSGSKDKALEYIPNNAFVVTKINLEQLQKKGALDEMLAKDTSAKNAEIQKAIELIKNSGVDLSSVFGYMTTDKDGLLIAKISDDKKLQETITKELGAIKKRNAYSYANNNDLAIAWDDEVLVVKAIKNSSYEQPTDTAGGTSVSVVPMGDETTVFDKVLAKDHKKNSLAEYKYFKNDFKKDNDVAIWINSGESMNATIGENQEVSRFIKKEMFEGSSSSILMNFDKGKITGDMISYSSEYMAEIFAKANFKSVDKSFVKSIAIAKPGVVAAFNLNPKFISLLLEKMGFSGMVDMALGAKGISLKDITDVLEGNIAMSMEFPDTTNTAMRYLVKVKINDKAKFESMLTKLGEDMIKINNGEFTIAGMSFKINDKEFVAASDKSLWTPGTLGISSDILGKLATNAGGVYMLPEKAFATLSKNDAEMKPLNIFEDILYYASDYSKKESEGKMVINFKDKNENALNQLVKAFKQMDKQKKEKVASEELITEETTEVVEEVTN